MRAVGEPTEIERLSRLNEFGPDDLFVCCASFEERCICGAAKMGAEFRVRHAIIFVIEEPLYKKQVDANLNKLQNQLRKRASESIFVISCPRDNPLDGLTQLKNIWPKCRPKDPEESSVTIDISGFTKIYLLELLYYLIIDLNLGIPRILHTVQSYSPGKLTRGVEQITTIPHFFGNTSLEKQTMLIAFLGFEPERSLAVWKHYNPKRTIALITNPPRSGNMEYVRYAEESNASLLSQPGVETRNVPADNPYGVKNVLDGIFEETKGAFNMVISPFGTKSQTVGIFLFCLEHPKVQVVYSFPSNYTKSYLQRKPGPTLLLPLAPMVAG